MTTMVLGDGRAGNEDVLVLQGDQYDVGDSGAPVYVLPHLSRKPARHSQGKSSSTCSGKRKG